MGRIELTTKIAAPRERCFDLVRSVDFHIVTAGESGERVVAGRLQGLLEAGERVTWRARHLGIEQELEVLVTVCERPTHLRDEMVRGVFASMRHDHRFDERDGVTTMHDDFAYRAPLGVLGRIAEALVVDQHLRRFLAERARILKHAAESERWRDYL